MVKRGFIIVGLLLMMLVTAVACSILQEPEAASGPIEAVPLEIETPAVTATPSDNNGTKTPEAGITGEEQADPTATETTTLETGDHADDGTESGGLTIYAIVSEKSQVRFELDEDLRGTRQTVVGTTNQVAAELAVDFADLSTVQLGTVQINARTLATDNNFRNRALRNEILHTGDYELITFTPTEINGLPDFIAEGGSVNFAIHGDLTIQDVTQQVVFEVTATAVSPTRITGTALAVINRSDYNINIPNVPNVANVEEEVELYIDFVAEKVE